MWYYMRKNYNIQFCQIFFFLIRAYCNFLFFLFRIIIIFKANAIFGATGYFLIFFFLNIISKSERKTIFRFEFYFSCTRTTRVLRKFRLVSSISKIFRTVFASGNQLFGINPIYYSFKYNFFLYPIFISFN